MVPPAAAAVEEEAEPADPVPVGKPPPMAPVAGAVVICEDVEVVVDRNEDVDIVLLEDELRNPVPNAVILELNGIPVRVEFPAK